ncbi:MAG: zinc ribbon domain-containing protein [Candidatus Bathyarchaeota archaeon]|nr:zinc ribbon domain-containing protein [Candidatus Bathyarchaeota archaeon]MDH5746659.1 zinc ribbon domain-containing protein [Candidatus Bathyarchaeota archaeon]
MPYCPKCGAEVTEETNFCSKCGAALGPLPPRVKMEKEEKHEKREKSEKAEKREKAEYGYKWIYIGTLLGGLLIIFAGLNAFLRIISPWYARYSEPIFLIVVGIIIIVIAIYATMTTVKRSPKPP